MPLTNAGRDYIATTLISTTTMFDNTNSYIGVGDSATAFAVTQTDLQAATNKLRKKVDAGYPTRATNVLTFQATFASAEANWAWNEWAVFNAASAGTMLCRKVETNGTKLSGQTWVFQVQITVNVGA
jgi:hypothetical protein